MGKLDFEETGSIERVIKIKTPFPCDAGARVKKQQAGVLAGELWMIGMI
jgi:hypothetical protein